MLRALGIFTLSLAVLAALMNADKAPQPARALGDPFACHAKIGVVANNTSDPVNYPTTASMQATFTQLQGGAFDFNFSGQSPIIPVSGAVSADNLITAVNSGTYNGLPSTVTSSGQVWWYDTQRTEPKRISLVQQIRSSASNPFPNIDYNFECFREPPASIADGDSDGVPDITHVTIPNVGNTVTSHLNPDFTNLIIRNFNQSTTPITLNDPTDFELDMSKSAYMEAIATRQRAETYVSFGGSLNTSGAGITLPSELGGGTRTSLLSGWERGHFAIYGSSGVGELALESGVAGLPFTLNANAQSGAWYTMALPVDPQNSTIDLGSGQLHLTGQFEAYFANIAAASSPQSSASSVGLGGPLIFDYEVTATFPSLAALAMLDNCPDVPNPDQADFDANGIGDACDGFFWADSDCDSLVTTLDALEATIAAAGIDTGASEDCEGGTSGPTPDSYEWGDWNCDGEKNANDALVILGDVADVAQSGLPDDCPAAGTFIPANTP